MNCVSAVPSRSPLLLGSGSHPLSLSKLFAPPLFSPLLRVSPSQPHYSRQRTNSFNKTFPGPTSPFNYLPKPPLNSKLLERAVYRPRLSTSLTAVSDLSFLSLSPLKPACPAQQWPGPQNAAGASLSSPHLSPQQLSAKRAPLEIPSWRRRAHRLRLRLPGCSFIVLCWRFGCYLDCPWMSL